MLVLNLSIGKTKKIFFICAALSMAAMLAVLVLVRAGAAGLRDTATCDEVGEYELLARTPGEQRAFLSRFGLDAGEIMEDEVTIPSEFNSVYEDYNELQRRIGLDLTPYKGERVKRLTFELNGSGNDPMYAVLLVREGRVIGGHLSDGCLGSPYRALTMKE